MKAENARRLEAENTRLKRIVADKELEIDVLREIAKGTGEPVPAPPGQAIPLTLNMAYSEVPIVSSAGPLLRQLLARGQPAARNYEGRASTAWCEAPASRVSRVYGRHPRPRTGGWSLRERSVQVAHESGRS
jgi:hypothetical protein